MRKTVLCLMICLLSLSCCVAGSEIIKEEVVYAKLTYTGEPLSVYVVNAFETDAVEEVTDYGTYTAILNLTDERALLPVSDALTLALSPGRFYYQGEMQNTELPWTFSLTYMLDGVPVAPEALPGANGDFEIILSVAHNERSQSILFENMTLQITMTFDGDRCTNIQAPKGTVASAGRNRTIAFVALPGMTAEYSVSARVTNFAMQGVQIAAIQMNMDTSMYVEAFTSRMADGPMKTSMASLVENMLSSFQGNGAVSFASEKNPTPAAVQFVMMTQEIPPAVIQKEAPAQTDAPDMGLWDRIKRLFN